MSVFAAFPEDILIFISEAAGGARAIRKLKETLEVAMMRLSEYEPLSIPALLLPAKDAELLEELERLKVWPAPPHEKILSLSRG